MCERELKRPRKTEPLKGIIITDFITLIYKNLQLISLTLIR